MAVGRSSRVLLCAGALALAACGGTSVTTTTTSTTAPATTTSTTLPEPAFVPPTCTDVPVTISEDYGPTTTVVPEALSADQQNEVLAALDEAVRDHYLYPDFNGADWEGTVAVLTADIAGGLDTAAFYERLDEAIPSLGDEHSYVETPADVAAAEAALAGTQNFVGIGVLAFPVPDEELITILAVYPDSAADFAGIDVHDSIVAIDGVPLGATPAVTGRRIRGPECSLVVMAVGTPGQEERIVSAVRFRVEGGIPIDARLVPTDDGRTIGYVQIPTLFDTTEVDQVRSALEAWGPLDGLILDLRVNGGGSSQVLEPLLGLFTSGTVGDFVSREGTRPLDIADEGINNTQTVPLVVLVGDDTESYAEVLAGTLGALGRATLIGETTQGNVETLLGYDLPDGSKLWLAGERFYPRADPEADWERDGIVPDVVVPTDWWDFTFETDPAIPIALEALAQG